MRVSVLNILILVGGLQLLLADPGSGQGLEDTEITMELKNESLISAFQKIEQQTDFLFAYREEQINGYRVTLDRAIRSLKEVLNTMLADTRLEYQVAGNKIIVKRTLPVVPVDTVMQWVSPPLNKQLQGTISGKVTDAATGNPLPGANVFFEGTSGGTATNVDGEYMLENVESGTYTLVATFIGYERQTREITVRDGETTTADFSLQTVADELGEVEVNAGYYTIKEREQTGNIEKVVSDEIELQPIVSPLEALQGRMAGVEVEQQNGVPGSAPVIRIRGRNSLRSDGNYPLYIIDGMPVNSTPVASGSGSDLNAREGIDPLSTLNLSNIESIEVLKDADATAIYGSRGANGVVLITTKGRTSYNQKTEVEARVYRGVSKVSKQMELVNTEQYLTLRRAALENDGRTPTESADYDLLLWDENRYTDWQEELFGDLAPVTDINMSVSGGNAATSFRLSGGYHKEEMVFPGDNSYHKLTTGLNLNHRSENDKLGVGLSVNYGIDQSDAFTNTNNIVSKALSLPPNAPALYNEEGGINWDGWDFYSAGHPIAEVFHTTADDEGSNLIANMRLSYQLFQGLTFKSNMGYTSLSRVYKGLDSNLGVSPENRDGTNHRSVENHRNRRSWIAEPQLVYHTNLGGGTIDGLLGATFQQNENEAISVDGEGFVSESLMGDLTAAEAILLRNSEHTEYNYNALFARIGYNWKQTYYINLTGRRDGSSRFGPNKRFSNFWAVGAAWIFTEASFVKDQLPFLSFGKIRGSYGTTGSDQIGDYGYLDAYEATEGPNGLYPTQLTNPDYSWEENKKLEAAIELGFIQDRINVGVSWYRNRSSNQLVGYPLPATTGFSSVQSNLPATVQNTGWEVELSTLNIRSRNFRWNTHFNITFPDNKLVSFPDMEQTPYANQYRVGHPLNIGLLYQYDGVDPETGLYRVLDVNEDGRYDFTDRVVVKNLGRQYFGGISNSLSYKGFGLQFLWEFARQESRSQSMGTPGALRIQTADFFEAWQNGENSDIQIVSQSSAARTALSRARLSERFIVDGTFLRLKTLSFSYNLPSGWLQHAGFKDCKLFLHAQNLFIITSSNELNIESPSRDMIPSSRTITGGIQLNL